MAAEPIEMMARRRRMEDQQTENTGQERSPAVQFAARIMGKSFASVVATPRGYILAIGDRDAAALLAQVQYLQQQLCDWFPYSASDWEADLGISKHIMNQCVKKLQRFGLEVKTMPTKPSVTTHWHIDEKKLEAALSEYVQQAKIYPLNAHAKKKNSPVNDANVDRQQAKIYPLNGEKFACSIEKEDLETNEEDQEGSDANASGGAAIAVAPVAVAPTRRQRKTAKTATPVEGKARASPSEDGDPLNVYRAACWKLLRDKYGQDVAKEGRELAAMKRMFEKKIPLGDVEGCWQATLIDPRWDTDPLTMAIVEEKLTVYRRNPEGYKNGMLKKRRDQIDREKAAEKRGASSNGQYQRVPAKGAPQRADSPEIAARREQLRREKHALRGGFDDDPSPAA